MRKASKLTDLCCSEGFCQNFLLSLDPDLKRRRTVLQPTKQLNAASIIIVSTKRSGPVQFSYFCTSIFCSRNVPTPNHLTTGNTTLLEQLMVSLPRQVTRLLTAAGLALLAERPQQLQMLRVADCHPSVQDLRLHIIFIDHSFHTWHLRHTDLKEGTFY